ncbi:cadherin-like domain-containing protein, partial [Reyranella soli]|uniref:cadherin-like domain-containing protein n=1 Tax=Reyranella soli TaxID=1230389 RepID=UPI0014786DCC
MDYIDAGLALAESPTGANLRNLWQALSETERALLLLESNLNNPGFDLSQVPELPELPSFKQAIAVTLNNLFQSRLLEPTYASYADPVTEPGYTPYTPPPAIGTVAKDYLAGATVFADFDQDNFPDEGEPSTTTDQDGHFGLFGWLGPLVVQGGIDTKTGLPFAGILEAPAGSATVTPLTTLLQGLLQNGVVNAETVLLDAFGLDPRYEVTQRDPIIDALNGTPLPFAAGVKVYDTAVGLSSFFSALADVPLTEVMSAAYSAIAHILATRDPGSTINLTEKDVLTAWANAVASDLNAVVSVDLISGVADILSALNGAIDQALASSFGSDLVTNIAAVQFLAQGTISNDLHSVGDGQIDIGSIVSQYTGTALQLLLADARVQLGGTAELNAAPHAADDAAVASFGEVLTIAATDLLSNDTDADGDTLSIIGVGGAINGTADFDPVAQEVTFTPNEGYSGPASFLYEISDGKGGISQASVNVNVGAPNTSPVGANDSLAMLSTQVVVISAAYLLSNDTDLDGDVLSITGVEGATNGTVAFDAAKQEVTFTPTAGYVGPASFVYGISDGKGGSSQATVTINVSAPANTNPVGVHDTASTTVDQPVVIAASHLLSNDTDADGDELSINGVGSGTNGTVDFNPATQEVTFTPTAGYAGPASFFYTISDGKGGIGLASVDVSVSVPGNIVPVAVDDTASTTAGQSVVIAVADLLSNDGDADGDPLSITSVGGATNGGVSFNTSAQQITFGPNPGYSGPASFTYTITDGKGGFSQASVNIAVDPVAEPPSAFAPYNSSSNTAVDLVNAMSASVTGVTVVSAEFVGADRQVSYYDGSLASLAIGSGVLLTSGDGTPPQVNTSPSYTLGLGGAGDTELSSILDAAGFTNSITYDAAYLQFSFDVGDIATKSISLDIVFGSDEYPEYAGNIVDIAAVLVNGVNYALFDGDVSKPLSVLRTNVDSGLFFNNNGLLPIEYDGVSVELSITAPVVQGRNTVKIAIADTTDTRFDSGLFISGFHASTEDTEGGIEIPGNRVPIAVDDTASTTMSQSVVIAAADLLANDTDADGNSLSVTGVGAATNGNVNFDPLSQKITFIPDAAYIGPASFVYQISDGLGGISQASVNVDVGVPLNTNPTDIALTPSAVAENSPTGTIVGSLSASDPDVGETFTFSL